MRDDLGWIEPTRRDRCEELVAVAGRISDREAKRQLALEHECIVEGIVGLEVGADDGNDPPSAGLAERQVESAG